MQGVGVLKRTLQRLRTEETFDNICQRAMEKGEELSLTAPKEGRKVRPPARFEQTANSASPHQFASWKEKARKAFYEGIDIVYSELEQRFSQGGTARLANLESLLLDSLKGCPNEQLFAQMTEFYSDDLDASRLGHQAIWTYILSKIFHVYFFCFYSSD